MLFVLFFFFFLLQTVGDLFEMRRLKFSLLVPYGTAASDKNIKKAIKSG